MSIPLLAYRRPAAEILARRLGEPRRFILCNGLAALGGTLHYWRERSREVDFVAVLDGRVVAIEVKSGRRPAALAGMQAFCEAFAPDRQLLVGEDGIAVEEFLSRPVEAWVG